MSERHWKLRATIEKAPIVFITLMESVFPAKCVIGHYVFNTDSGAYIPSLNTP